MSNELSNTEKLSEFFEELKRLDIKVVRPCINECYAEFVPKSKKIADFLKNFESSEWLPFYDEHIDVYMFSVSLLVGKLGPIMWFSQKYFQKVHYVLRFRISVILE